ncbi:chemotaxis protein CheD [Oxalobacteraceae bacterium A2-2]
MITTDAPPDSDRRASPRAPGSRALQEDFRAMVAMGHLKVGARTEQLQAVLGSCVGIALLWKKGGVSGLAHCLLPEPAGGECSGGQCGRYVSRAVPELLRLMGVHQDDYGDIEVYLAGGANMLSGCSSRLHIGEQNVAAAQKILRQYSLNVHYSRVGGHRGRTMLVDCAEQLCFVREIQAPQQESQHAHY